MIVQKKINFKITIMFVLQLLDSQSYCKVISKIVPKQWNSISRNTIANDPSTLPFHIFMMKLYHFIFFMMKSLRLVF